MKKKKLSINIAICIALMWMLIYVFIPVPAHAGPISTNIVGYQSCTYVGNTGEAFANNVLYASHSGYDGGLHSIMKFDLSSIPDSAIINSAKLKIYEANNNSFFGNANFWTYHVLDDSWTETNIPLSVRNSLTKIHTYSGPLGYLCWYDVDITPTVQSEVSSGDNTLSLSNYSDVNASLYFKSTRDNTNGRPYLEITYAVPPTITSVVGNSTTQITVNYSEDCIYRNSSGFKVTEKGNPSIEYPIISTANGASNQSILTVADMSKSAKEGVTVTYTKGFVRNNSGTFLETDSTGKSIDGWKTSPPIFTAANELPNDNTYMDIAFGEGVYSDDYGQTGLNPSDFIVNFTQNGGTATGVSISSVTKTDGTALSGGESAVRVFLNVTGTPSGIEKIKIKPANASTIFDIAGNAVLTSQTTGDKTMKDQLQPTTTSPALNSDTKMTLALSEACTDIDKSNDGGFTIEQTGTPSITYEVFSVSEGSIILNTADMGASAKEGVTLKYTPGGNGTIKDSAGNLMASFTTTFAPWDTVAPTITTTSALAANNAYIDVSMSEGIYTADNGTGGLIPSDFTLNFTQNGGTATGVSISSVTKTDGTALSGGESAVRVFFNVTGTPSGVETIKINPANASVYDKAGNAVSLGQTTGVKTLNDKLPPTTTSPALNSNTKMTLALSEACTDIVKNNDGGFTIEQTGTPGITYEVFSVSEGSIILNTADMSASAKEGVTLKYTPGGNGTIKDSVGNLMTSFTTTFAPWDTVAPTITTTSALAANNAHIDVSMSEGVYTADNGTGGLIPSDFTLTFTQNGGTATGVSISSVTKTDGTALSGGESAVRVFFNVTGTPSGVETIKINPANASVYDKAGNAVSLGQTTGVKTLNDKLPPTTTSPTLNSNTKMTLALSEACTDIAKNNDGGFTIEQTGTPGITYEVFSVSEGSIILNTADMSASAKEGVTLKYTPGGNGTIKDIAGNSMASFTTTFAAWAISNNGGGIGGTGGTGIVEENDNKASVIIGGESHDDVMKLETVKTNDGRTEATIILNEKTKDVIDKKPDGTSFKINFPRDYDINNLVMTGDIVKKMEEKAIVLDITANSSTIALPAADIKIDDVAKSFGDNVALKDITVKIIISTPDANMSAVITKKAENSGFSIVAPTVDFAINCTYKNNTVAVTEFNSYVQNTTKLPDGITSEKITTAICTNKDGTFHHVPTKITIINGVYYAVINSMISGTFTFVYHPVSFPDVEKHWSKAVVNDMASRFIVNGYENGLYVPNGYITRAEFTAIIIRAMGLPEGMKTNTFTDVPTNKWYNGYVTTASKYGLISGYSSEKFGPNDKITREQAITIIARMMNKIKYDVSLTEEEKDILFADFEDNTDISDYARDSLAACLKSGVVVGRSETTIKPKGFLTRAEAAALLQRVLSKSGLI